MLSVIEMLINSAEKYPDKIAFRDPNKSISYFDLNDKANLVPPVFNCNICFFMFLDLFKYKTTNASS